MAAPSNHADLRARRIALTLPSPAVGEPQVVPLAAVTLTQQEWDAIGKHAVIHIPRNMSLHLGNRDTQLAQARAHPRGMDPLLVGRPARQGDHNHTPGAVGYQASRVRNTMPPTMSRTVV